MPTLSTVNTRNSSIGVAPAHEKNNRSLFGAIKSAFKPKKKPHGSGGSGDGSTSRTRRLSTFSIGSAGSSESRKKHTSEEELERRRANCLAIKSAKRDPIEVQRLLVDCEFCNPPPKFGINVPIITPQFTAETVRPPTQEEYERMNHEPEAKWNPGLREWLRIREFWNTPTSERQPEHHLDPDVKQDRYFVIYNRFVRFTRPLKKPLNLDDVLKIVKTGWVCEGEWHEDPSDKWSDLEDEELPLETASGGTTPQPPAISVSPVPYTSPDSRRSSTRPEREDDDGPGRVQFNDRPHPRYREDGDTPVDEWPPQRPHLTATSTLSLMPTRSNHSSVISLTDEE